MLKETQIILVWDLPLRLFHWLLVMGVVTACITGEIGGLWLELHSQAGIFTLALIIFRFVWGFLGSTHSRFINFFPTPFRLRTYFSDKWRNIGHNPLSALSVFALLGLISVQAGFGLFAMNDDIEFHGPLYELVNTTLSKRLTSWHAVSFYGLLLFIAIHVSAIGYYAWFKGENLVLPMITGKTKPDYDITPQIYGGGKLQLIIAVSTAGIVFWSIESGALVQYLSSVQPISSATTVPSW